MTPAAGGARATVAIPTRGRPDGLATVVRDLMCGRRRPDEIVVVCQGGDPHETARRLAADAPDAVSVLRFFASTRRGVNASRNDALRLATGDFVAFTDDDMRLPPTWLEALLAAWESEWKGAPVLLTGPIHAPGDAAEPEATPGRREGSERRVWRAPPAVGDVLYGGHFGAPRAAYARAGSPPFDERFGPGALFPGAGDDEFALRLLRAGVPVAFEPTIEATHVARSRDWVRDQYSHSQGTGGLLALRWASGDRAALGVATRTVSTCLGKGVKAGLSLRGRVAAGRLAAVVGITVGAWRWWRTGASGAARAVPASDEEVRPVQLD